MKSKWHIARYEFLACCRKASQRAGNSLKIFLKWKWDEDRAVSKYETWFVVRANKESCNEDDCSSLVIEFKIFKLLFRIAKQKGNLADGHLGFWNAFHNGKLERPVYIEVPGNIRKNTWHTTQVMKLNWSLYGLKDFAKNWSDTIWHKFREFGSQELKSAPCAFRKGENLSSVMLKISWFLMRTNLLSMFSGSWSGLHLSQSTLDNLANVEGSKSIELYRTM